MKTYMITYDLRRPGKDYSGLISEITRLGGVKILLSAWVLKTSLTAAQLRNRLSVSGSLDANDMLLVAGLSGEAAWTGLMIANESLVKILAA